MEYKEFIRALKNLEVLKVGDWMGVDAGNEKYHIHKVDNGFILSKSEDNENYKFYKKLSRNDLIDFLKDVNGVIF
jgi:hypothetical protein